MEQHWIALPTMTVVAGMVWLLATLVVLFAVGIAWTRPSYPGWRTWAAGHSALVLGLLIGTVRTPDTLLLCILAGNGLVMLGALLYLHALRRFSGRPPSRRRAAVQVGSTLGVVLALLLLTVVVDNLLARLLLVSAYLIGVKVALVRVMLAQQRAQPALRGAYRLQLALLVTVGALTLPRTVSVGPGDAWEAAFALTVPNVLMYVAVIVLAVGGTLAFWLLHEDRRRLELGQLHEDLTAQAEQDPLTALLNRRGLWQAFARWARQPARPATLLVLDINEFKTINDGQGHAAGDQCLRQLAGALSSVAQPGDLVSRVGGDEFVVMLTGVPAQVEAQLAALHRRFHDLARAPTGFTTSVGRTQVAAGEALDRAIHRADTAMYGHKEARGRLPVVWVEAREVG